MAELEVFEQARVYLPKYLSPDKLKELWEELKAFPKNRSYYSSVPELAGQLLQGDGWRGFVVIDFRTLSKKTVSGIILSNSCDINPDNARAVVPNVLFVPLLRLDGYCDRLRAAGQTSSQIDSITESIRNQRSTSIFYLPSYGEALPESIAVLNDVHQHPLDDFLAAEKAQLFTLAQFAWYLFLLKVSVHFMRMQEDVAR